MRTLVEMLRLLVWLIFAAALLGFAATGISLATGEGVAAGRTFIAAIGALLMAGVGGALVSIAESLAALRDKFAPESDAPQGADVQLPSNFG